jgi:hypothetical protein
MAGIPQPHEFTIRCPLCEHQLHIEPGADAACEFCGAELAAFEHAVEANQFAETRKADGENAVWRRVEDATLWVVAHKASPIESRD